MVVAEGAHQSLKKVTKIGKSFDGHGEDCAWLVIWLQLMKVYNNKFYAFEGYGVA